MRAAISAMALLGLVAMGGSALAQANTNRPPVVAGAKPVTIRLVKMHSAAVAGNLEGNSAERDVLVVLPPSYATAPQRRYPVVYALHGYSIGAEQWSKEIHIPQTVEGAFGKGAREMIVVLPDSKTLHNGSMYSNSITTGGFEDFIAKDLVAWVDANFRTIPVRQARGLVGHSMGGYGASRIGMKHADVFGSLYIMSPCCMSPRGAGAPGGRGPAATPGDDPLEGIKTAADAQKLPFGLRANLAAASAWSPNPKNPPLFVDLPVGGKEADVLAKWAANAPLAFVDQYVANLRKYRGIAIDVGDADGLRTDTAKLHDILDSYSIANSFEIYPGDHTNNLGYRFQDFVLPFFSKNLSFEQPAR